MKSLDDLTNLPQNINNVPGFICPNGYSTERNISKSIMEFLELDAKDWRLQEKLIFIISPWVQYERENRK
jgi:hypothetical protein